MQTKHLCVLIHIWSKGEVGALLNWFKPSSKIFLLTVPRQCFFCGSFVLFLSCFVILSCTSVCWCLVITCWERADLLALVCDHCLFVTMSLSHWYPGSGVVLYCIDSWSLPSFLLFNFDLYDTQGELRGWRNGTYVLWLMSFSKITLRCSLHLHAKRSVWKPRLAMHRLVWVFPALWMRWLLAF